MYSEPLCEPLPGYPAVTGFETSHEPAQIATNRCQIFSNVWKKPEQDVMEELKVESFM